MNNNTLAMESTSNALDQSAEDIPPCRRKRAVKQRTMSVEDTMELYYRTEYDVVTNREVGLTLGGFARLMTMLRLPEGFAGAQMIWHKHGKSERSTMSEDEYVKLMQRNKLLAKATHIWRYMFSICDTDGTGWATKKEVLEGLEDMGIPVDKNMEASVDAMDRDHDDHVYYRDFLISQLQMKDKT